MRRNARDCIGGEQLCVCVLCCWLMRVCERAGLLQISSRATNLVVPRLTSRSSHCLTLVAIRSLFSHTRLFSHTLS